MINLLVDGGEISYNAKGNILSVCTEELCAIDYLRDKLAEQMEIGKETANKMIMESLIESAKVGGNDRKVNME